MNLLLIRKEFRPDGIFSELYDESNNLIAVTLEHSYLENDKYVAKIPYGNWTCKKGLHRLHGMTQDFTTYEITGISGHSNLLFHWGNYNKDSEGCILLGESIAPVGTNNEMITNSKITFNKFMSLLNGADSFVLTVT